jgi:hypothetical protein
MFPRFSYFGERVRDRGCENGAKKKIFLDAVHAFNRDDAGGSGGVATVKRVGNFY